jgi:hypothetical protein
MIRVILAVALLLSLAAFGWIFYILGDEPPLDKPDQT